MLHRLDRYTTGVLTLDLLLSRVSRQLSICLQMHWKEEHTAALLPGSSEVAPALAWLGWASGMPCPVSMLADPKAGRDPAQCRQLL